MSQEAKVLTGIGVATLIIVIAAAFLFGGKSAAKNATDSEVVKITADQKKKLIKPESHVLGKKNAKVTIVEFGDFQCPACGASYPIVSKLLQEYDGKVTFVFRQFPLTMHKNARTAANVAEAAGAQGKFFEMYDVLYENQKDWGESNKAMEYFEQYAQEVKLDMDKFKDDVEKKAYDNSIKQDLEDGNAVGVTATPTFFINDEKISGGLPYDDFKAKIEAALK